jgi:hypothetical protein
MRKFKLLAVLAMVVLLVGCVGIQEKWTALTPDEKGRVVLNDLQTQLNTLFDTGKAFVIVNPKHQETWKGQIVPAFDAANKALRASIELSKTKPITPEQAYAQIQPLINSVITLLVSIGAVKPIQSQMDVSMVLLLINGLLALAFNFWATARKVFGTEAIPSWEEITDKNKILQDKIDAEKAGSAIGMTDKPEIPA